jgi:hypothetical protein
LHNNPQKTKTLQITFLKMIKQPIKFSSQSSSSQNTLSTAAVSSSTASKPKIVKPKIDNFKSMKALLYSRKRPNARQMALYRRMIAGTSK